MDILRSKDQINNAERHYKKESDPQAKFLYHRTKNIPRLLATSILLEATDPLKGIHRAMANTRDQEGDEEVLREIRARAMKLQKAMLARWKKNKLFR